MSSTPINNDFATETHLPFTLSEGQLQQITHSGYWLW